MPPNPARRRFKDKFRLDKYRSSVKMNRGKRDEIATRNISGAVMTVFSHNLPVDRYGLNTADKGGSMKIDEVKKSVAMPVTSPSFPPGPTRFRNREFLIIDYETDMDALRAVVPEPLEVDKPVVRYEFIRMPDSDGFGSYNESGQVIPVRFNGKAGSYVHAMYLDDVSPIVGGRELWGFPKKYAHPEMHVDRINKDCYVAALKYGELEVVRATMAYKWQRLDKDALGEAVAATPNFLLKIIPDVDNTPKICQLVRYFIVDLTVKEAWTGPASLQLFSHCMAPVADLPIKRVTGAVHFIADLTLGLGDVAYDYLKE